MILNGYSHDDVLPNCFKLRITDTIACMIPIHIIFFRYVNARQVFEEAISTVRITPLFVKLSNILEYTTRKCWFMEQY